MHHASKKYIHKTGGIIAVVFAIGFCFFFNSVLYAKTPYELCIEGGGGASCSSRAGAPSTVTSSTPCLPTATSLCNPLGSNLNDPKNIPLLIGNVIKGLFGVIGTIALVIFIYGGFLWMTAFGEEGRIKKGWDTMIWAGMGLAVIFGSYVAVDFILKAILGS